MQIPEPRGVKGSHSDPEDETVESQSQWTRFLTQDSLASGNEKDSERQNEQCDSRDNKQHTLGSFSMAGVPSSSELVRA